MFLYRLMAFFQFIWNICLRVQSIGYLKMDLLTKIGFAIALHRFSLALPTCMRGKLPTGSNMHCLKLFCLFHIQYKMQQSLHTSTFLGRDIKGGNILVGPNDEVKLADFGLAKHVCSFSFPFLSLLLVCSIPLS